MSKITRKITGILLLTITFALLSGGHTFAQDTQETNSVEKEIQETNEAMADMKDKVNERLANGEKHVVEKRTLSFSDEPLVMEIDTNKQNELASKNQLSTNQVGTLASDYTVGNYEGTLSLPAGSLNSFSHTLNIDWTYDSASTVIDNVIPRNFLTGLGYLKSSTNSVLEFTPSVHQVTSTGSFRPYNIPTLEYRTIFTIQVNGTGTAKVIDTYLGS